MKYRDLVMRPPTKTERAAQPPRCLTTGLQVRTNHGPAQVEPDGSNARREGMDVQRSNPNNGPWTPVIPFCQNAALELDLIGTGQSG